MKHTVNVRKREITIMYGDTIVQNGINADRLSIVRDDEWNDVDSMAVVFENGDVRKKVLVTEADGAKIPWEVLEQPGELFITVIGYVGDEVRVITERMEKPFKVEVSGAIEGDNSQEPTPSEIRQVAGMVASEIERAKNMEVAISNRISNIVATSGTAGESSSEITDARFSELDSTVHTSLKDRLDADTNTLSKYITDLAEEVSLMPSSRIVVKKLAAKMDSDTVTASVSNRTGFYPVNPGSEVCIERGELGTSSGTYFHYGFVAEIGIGQTIVNRGTFAVGESRTLTVPDGCNYLAIWYYNSGDPCTEQEIRRSINVYSPDHNTALMKGVGSRVEVLEAELEERKKVQEIAGTAEVKTYFAAVSNPTDVPYTNYPCRIRVNFPYGLCKNADCIVVKEDGNIVPFSFEGCRDENILLDKDYTYHNDGSIRCGSLVVVSSVPVGDKVVYTVEVHPSPVQHNFDKGVTVETEGVITQVRTANLSMKFNDGNDYAFLPTDFKNASMSDWSMVRLEYNFTDASGNWHNEREIGFMEQYIEDYSYELLGDGVTYLTVKRVVSMDKRRFIQFITFYANDKVEVENYVVFDEQDDSTKAHYCRCYFYTQDGEMSSSSAINDVPMYSYVDSNGKKNMVGLLFTTRNTQRDNQNLPIYENTSLADNLTTAFGIRYGFKLVNTDYWQKGFVGYNKIVYGYDVSDGEEYRRTNNLVSFATDGNYAKSSYDAKNTMLAHAHSLAAAFLEAVPDSNSARRYMYDTYIRLVEYLVGVGTIGRADAAFKEMMTKWYGGTTAGKINEKYVKSGMEFVGRSISAAYPMLVYTGDDYYRNIIKEYGDFIVSVCSKNNGDFPLHDGEGCNSNSRCTALYGLALAIDVVSDNATYKAAFEKLNGIVADNVISGTIQPEGSAVNSKYLHYTAFANFFYSLALKHYSPENVAMTSVYNYMFDAAFPSGELKDLTYCSSDSRRGKPHTYAYAAGVLALSADASATAQALKVVEWVSAQTPAFGDYPKMLDGYYTYDYQTAIEDANFAIAATVDTIAHMGIL